MEKDIRYCSDSYFCGSNCSKCKKAGICDLFIELVTLNVPKNEAKEQCHKLERIGITQKEAVKVIQYYKQIDKFS